MARSPARHLNDYPEQRGPDRGRAEEKGDKCRPEQERDKEDHGGNKGRDADRDHEDDVRRQERRQAPR